jgi:hypothetical protein
MPCLTQRAGRTRRHLTENSVFYPQQRRMQGPLPLSAAAAQAPPLSNLFFPRPEFAQGSRCWSLFFPTCREQ